MITTPARTGRRRRPLRGSAEGYRDWLQAINVSLTSGGVSCSRQVQDPAGEHPAPITPPRYQC